MSFATTSTQELQRLFAEASSHCAKCQQPAEHVDDEGFCGGCLDSRTCPDCAEHYDAARGPCPCVVERAELADERRDAWIDTHEALALADGFGAEQPEDCAEECPDCLGLGLGRVIVRNDTNLGVGAGCDCAAGDALRMTAAELDRAVAHDEQRACRGEVL